MKLVGSVIFSLILQAFAVWAASDSPVAGKWNCHSVDERGTEVAWTLEVTDQAGKLAGVLTIAQTGDRIEILEPKLNGTTFTFKIQINAEEVVELRVDIDGTKLQGTFKGKSSGTGTVAGSLER